ncbi:hypothetical protein HCN44_010259 [Aphidius gifuensis]|uniref:Gustatory receptor n=1 Tax=Aphidius gifuensis TaxID=684658 RepID=A0A835CS86_APHGI|nr:hypothetical protein HCN44_010259 [Aphidius gifuensis]
MMFNIIKPFNWGGRAFGGSLYEVTNNNYVVTIKGIIYSILLGLFGLANSVLSCYLSVNDTSSLKVKFLTIGRTIIGYCCFFLDIFMTVYLNKRLTSAFNHLRIYDITSKFNEKMDGKIKPFHSSILTLIVITCWITVGLLTYCTGSTGILSILNGIEYFHFYMSISMQILNFCGLMMMIYQRFDNLCYLIIQKESTKINIKIISHFLKNVGLRDVWRMHCSLAKAAEEINTIYSLQLFGWVFTFSLNALSRIYSIMTIDNNSDNCNFFILRELVSAIGSFLNVFIIALSCHLISRRANQVAENIFSPISTIRSKRNSVEGDNAANAYFCNKKLYFTAAAGLFVIRLPLLLSIVGAMTTYLVILHKSSSNA